MKDQSVLYSGIVWLISALALLVYGVFGLLLEILPGVEQLVDTLALIAGKYIYLAAFITILIEGLYIVGNFFPGSSMVLILAVLSQIVGPIEFLLTILTIFVGWCFAGIINIYLTKQYTQRMTGLLEKAEFQINDRPWTTWFPPFRANYEVAQMVEGGSVSEVFFSSVRVKLWACGGMSLLAFILPFFIDIHEVSNEEGFVTLAIIAVIMVVVGGKKVYRYNKTKVVKLS